MTTKTYYLVTYYSPGTLFSESSSYEFKEFSLWEFVQKAKKVKERYGASPYGFDYQKLEVPVVLPKVEDFKVDVEPKVLETSGMFYLTGEIILSENLTDPDDRILKDNLENNYDGIGIVNTNSYKFHAGFNKEDNIINWDGLIIRRGNDKDLMDYRKKIKQKKELEYKKLGF